MMLRRKNQALKSIKFFLYLTLLSGSCKTIPKESSENNFNSFANIHQIPIGAIRNSEKVFRKQLTKLPEEERLGILKVLNNHGDSLNNLAERAVKITEAK